MKTQTVFLWVLFIEIIGFAVFMFLPMIHSQQSLDSPEAEHAAFRTATRRATNQYRLILTALFIAFISTAYLLLARWQTLRGVILIGLGFNIAALYCYITYARQVKPFAVASPITRYTTALRTRHFADYTRLWVEAVVLAITLGPVILLLCSYTGLPDQIPVHWNIAGEPDRWTRKSLGSVFFIPALSVYLQAIFLLVKYDLVHARMILPPEHTAEVLHYKDQFLKTSVHLTDWVRILLALLFAGLAVLLADQSSSNIIPDSTALANTLIWIAAVLFLGGLSYFIWRLLRIKRDLALVSDQWNSPRSIDQQYWRDGGLVYSNPEDSAVLVEKLVGLGYTYNMANRGVYLRLATLVGVPVFIVWAFLYLT